MIGSSGDKTFTPDFTSANSADSCTVGATLEFLNPSTNTYIMDNDGTQTTGTPYEFVKSFSLSSGALVINTSNNSKYGLRKQFHIRISIKLPESLDANN